MKLTWTRSLKQCLMGLFALACILTVASTSTVTHAAQAGGEPEATEQAEGNGDSESITRKERRKAAKERRIREYLERREAKRVRKAEKNGSEERSKDEKDAQRIERELRDESGESKKKAQRELSEDEQAVMDKMTRREARKVKKQAKRADAGDEVVVGKLPRRLQRVQDGVRASKAAQDPAISAFLDRIEREQVSATDLAAFGNNLAGRGMINEALEYYDVALSMEKKNPTLWMNFGTLHRQLGGIQQAASSYARALSIDPNNADAHYNLGAALDEMGKYEAAIEEYKLALMLKPDLGDPTVNPQAANNERLVAVKMMLYQASSGGLGLPLQPVKSDGTR